MKKRVQHLLSVLLVLCMAFALYSLPVSAAEAASAETGTKDSPWNISAEEETDNVSAWYEGSEQDGYTLFISGEGRMTASFRSDAPPWKSIKSNIASVEIEEGVTNVGAYAFNFCKALKTVSLPDSLSEIGTYAFHSTSVKHLTIPANVQTIGRMIANPTTYYEVLGSPESVNDHAFNTSLVSVPDQATAEALNAKTNVSAIIVLNGGVYGESDEDLANLSYGLIAPVKEDCAFSGWYQNADCSGQPLSTDRNGRTTTNINNIYYAKWEDAPESTPTPEPSGTPSEAHQEVSAPANAESVKDAITLPDGYTLQESDSATTLIPGGFVTVTATSEDGSIITYRISKDPELIIENNNEYEIAPDQKPIKYHEITKDGELVIKSTGALDRLQEVKVDDQVVAKSNYTLKSGSTILTFKKDYLDTLPVGDHDIELTYEVGKVEVLLKVTESAAPTDTPVATPTPEPSGTTTAAPTQEPSGTPTAAPTQEPSGIPTAAPTQVPSDSDTATPSPIPSQMPSDNAPPTDSGDINDQADSQDSVPSEAETSDQSTAVHSPKTGDSGGDEISPNGTAETQNRNGRWFLFIAIAVAVVLLGTYITVLICRKHDNDNDEGRKER